MELIEKQHFEPVLVEDESPKYEDDMAFAIAHVDFKGYQWAQYNSEKDVWKSGITKDEIKGEKVDHWLKRKHGITLQKDELIGLLRDAFKHGQFWAETYQGWFKNTDDEDNKTFEKFLTEKGLK